MNDRQMIVKDLLRDIHRSLADGRLDQRSGIQLSIFGHRWLVQNMAIHNKSRALILYADEDPVPAKDPEEAEDGVT